MEPNGSSGTYLTLSRRFAFCASHRVERAGLTAAANRELYGDEAAGAFGHGHNYVATFVLAGEVDPATGMMVSLRSVKELLSELVDGRYDHRFLNLDTPPFGEVPATAENVARRLLLEAGPLFGGSGARPVACHLVQSPGVAATAYGDGSVESHRWITFSASAAAPNRRRFSSSSKCGEAVRRRSRARLPLPGVPPRRTWRRRRTGACSAPPRTPAVTGTATAAG